MCLRIFVQIWLTVLLFCLFSVWNLTHWNIIRIIYIKNKYFVRTHFIQYIYILCVICLYRDYSLRLRYTRGLLIGLFTGFLIYCVRICNIIYLFDNFTIQFYLFRIHFDNMDFVASLILVFILKYSLFYNYGIF